MTRFFFGALSRLLLTPPPPLPLPPLPPAAGEESQTGRLSMKRFTISLHHLMQMTTRAWPWAGTMSMTASLGGGEGKQEEKER